MFTLYCMIPHYAQIIVKDIKDVEDVEDMESIVIIMLLVEPVLIDNWLYFRRLLKNVCLSMIQHFKN